MDFKTWSWVAVAVGILLNILGLFWFVTLIFATFMFVLGVCSIIHLHNIDVNQYLGLDHPLAGAETGKKLGLNLDSNPKLIIPNENQPLESSQIGSKDLSKLKSSSDGVRKKRFIDTGFDFIFKKHSSSKANHHSNPKTDANDFKFRSDVVYNTAAQDHPKVPQQSTSQDDGHRKWHPFETIKIYTDRKRSLPSERKDNKKEIHIGEECNISGKTLRSPTFVTYKLHNDSANLNEHGSPKHKLKAVLSGHKQSDHLIHMIIDYILRDFIDSWFSSLSDNKEFSEFRTRQSIEESLQNVCSRIKKVPWVQLITTKLIDNIATHSRLYRLAQQTIKSDIQQQQKAGEKAKGVTIPTGSSAMKMSPQRRAMKRQQSHRRNKSDTDLGWYMGNVTVQKTVANSKFYTDPIDEKSLLDPETKLINAFFNQCDLYKNECSDERALESYLSHVMETVLYFSLPKEDFSCLPLRMFLKTLLANVVFKPLLELLADPDFINLQVARLCSKEPPPGEYFIKLIRQCTDLSELRACRQLLTKEMDLKHKDPTAVAELASLKYTQNIVDLRISYLQTNKSAMPKFDRDNRPSTKLPILTLDELLTKELALSYYLDYLSILNLQKYVIFYLSVQEWKQSTNRFIIELQTNKSKSTKDEVFRVIRDRAYNIYAEYLVSSSTNCLTIDHGLIEVLGIRLRDTAMSPDSSWFDSICKFVYEKLKNEDVFLNNFYQSSAYKKLLLELEFCDQSNNSDLSDSTHSQNGNPTTVVTFEVGSGKNSPDLDDDDDDDDIPPCVELSGDISPIKSMMQTIAAPITGPLNNLDISMYKHSRSHSDCTGLVADGINDTFDHGPNDVKELHHPLIHPLIKLSVNGGVVPHEAIDSSKIHLTNKGKGEIVRQTDDEIKPTVQQQRLTAKIINTAIHCDGQYAVYAINVTVIEDNQQKSWHIYRRYSKFLELKKFLVKRYPNLSRIPFPAKKTFQNTQRSVLEHRMLVLNEFLRVICLRADDFEDINSIMRAFFEPDTNDKRMHGGVVIRTIETLVNPFKTGMRTIKNMPDTVVGGLARILLGTRGPMKDSTFLDVTPIHLDHSSEYPALTSALNLLDEIFDLQARSQWLRRGIINRLLGAPWVSHTANKRIIHAAKTSIDTEKIEFILTAVISSIWPDGKRIKKMPHREDNTKLRTRMAAKISMFALLSDELKHVVGSETTRSGLLNCFSMWQHKQLNMRILLVLFNDILTTMYQTDNMTKHIRK